MINRAPCLVLAALLIGCTAASEQSDEAATPSTEPTSAVAADAELAAETSTTTSASTDTSTAASADPLRPAGDTSLPSDDNSTRSAYVSRVTMSATSIELTWASYDGATEYHLHRIPRSSNDRPELTAMTEDNTVHIATDAGRFNDETVEAGTLYWYGVRAISDDGTLIAHGWHRADAVTDTKPPGLVGDLSATVDNGEVLVTWTTPEEDYQLHGYQVFRAIDGGEPESIATTWRLEQTSFVDDDPPTSGTVTYLVEAFDFHWNESALAEVNVRLP